MTNLASLVFGYESGSVCTKRPVLKTDSFSEPDIIKCNPDGHQTDPIAATYSSTLFDQRLLAMADYDGYVSMINTSELLPDHINVIDEPEQNVKAQWIAHHNAINDLSFIKGDRQLLTAATDFNLRQWDTMTATCLATLAGHSASVKCLAVHPVCSDVVASGGKDGSIMLWDLRVPSCATEQFPVRGAQVHVEVAHRPRSHSGGIFSQSGSDVSVTSLQFLRHSGLLASASDTSSTVKLWDVRMMEDHVAFLPAELPPDTTLPPHLNMVPLSNHLDFTSTSGLCHLSTDPDGLWLSVMRRDGRIHMYDALRADCSIQPSREFKVSEPLTLRSSSAISPDGLWLAATSAYGSTFVFNVNDTSAPPARLQAGQSGVWQRRHPAPHGDDNQMYTATRLDAEVTGVCWGSLGSGELAICRTAQQLQVWRSDYVNHDLGMKAPSSHNRARWPTFFEPAAMSLAREGGTFNSSGLLSAQADLEVPAVQPAAAPVATRTASQPRLSGQASVNLPRQSSGAASTFVTPASTGPGQRSQSQSTPPGDENAAQSAPASPEDAATAAAAPPTTTSTPTVTAVAAAVTRSSAAAAGVATSGASAQRQQQRKRNSSTAPASGTALSAALLLPSPCSGHLPDSAAAPPHATCRSTRAASANSPHIRTTHTAQTVQAPDRETAAAAAATTTSPETAAGTPVLGGATGGAAPASGTGRRSPGVHAADADASEKGLDSGPPSRSLSGELQAPAPASARPSQHGLNNTFVEIALSPQRLSRPARSLGDGLSPTVRALSLDPGSSPLAHSNGRESVHRRSTASGSVPRLHAPLATLSSADLIRSPRMLMRGGPAAQASWGGPTATLSPINEASASGGGGQELVPDTQSIDGSPLNPTVAPVATQFSQARQQLTAQALRRPGGQPAPLMPNCASAAVVAGDAACCAAAISAGWQEQTVASPSQYRDPSDQRSPTAGLQPWGASTPVATPPPAGTGAGADVVMGVKTLVPQAERSRSRRSSRSRRTASQEAPPQTCHASARTTPQATSTACAPQQSGASSGAPALREHRPGRKHKRAASCSLTPEAAHAAAHSKFQPPICDSQPKEVVAIVSCKRRRITATAVQPSSRSREAFKMAGICDPVAIPKDNSVTEHSRGWTQHVHNAPCENDAHVLNIAAQQDCGSQDSHSVVASRSRKMAVGASLQALVERTQSKAGKKASKPCTGRSQPSIMNFFRRD